MYAITAQVQSRQGDWAGTIQVPTFYLDENVQGITGAVHATRVAAAILAQTATTPVDVAICATHLESERQESNVYELHEGRVTAFAVPS
jgi:hypothetical protein